MKIRTPHRLALIALLLLALPALGSAQASEKATRVDKAWAELESLGLLKFERPKDYESLTIRQRYEYSERLKLLLKERGLAFYESFPSDPRRWTVVWQMLNRAPEFIKSYGPNADSGYKDFVIDEAAASAWKKKLTQLEADMLAAADLPINLRQEVDQRQLTKEVFAFNAKVRQGHPVDWQEIIQQLLDFAVKYPSAESSAHMAKQAMYTYEARHKPVESAVAWRAFLASPNQELADMAREKVRALEAVSSPVELTFTALDGREVDLGKLRGKVVLLDFWATWCGPCMAEMPNVKKVYATYRDKGFEVVGISCDVAPEEATSEAWKKIARTGPQVWEFCQKNDMPWPQHYEGRKHSLGENSIAARFAVTGIPATFLLDRNGMVTSINARGEKLEAEVKRLLKL